MCLLSSINNTLHKLETFHMIWGYQRNLKYYDEDTMKEWIRFSRADLIEEYKIHLSLVQSKFIMNLIINSELNFLL